jgi:transposase
MALRPVARPDIPARPPGLIEIALCDGTTVRVDAGIDPRALRRVLAALRGRSSCHCCGAPLHAIAEDRSEMLDYVPAQIRVQVIRRPRYGCRACEGAVVQAPAPERPIDGGLATEALLAHVLVNKYCDHRVPRTHRQRWRCGAM